MVLMASMLMFSGEVIAQRFPSQMWHKGFVLTAKKDTVAGSIQ